MLAPLIVLTGPPRAGKTTVASLVAETFARSSVVAGDDFFNFLRTGKISPWLPESRQQNETVINVTINAAAGYARDGWTTVLEGIFGPWFLPAIQAGTTGIELHYFVLKTPLETCIDRFCQREPGTSTEVVKKMHDEFERANVQPRHLIDGDQEPSAVAAIIGQRIEQQAAVIET